MSNSTTPRSSRIEDLEILRAIAVILVFVHHCKGNLIYWRSEAKDIFFTWFGGDVGVDLFFGISGYIIARSLLPKLKQSADNRQFFRITIAFWIRRFWRLVPSAWFWLAFPLLLFVVFSNSSPEPSELSIGSPYQTLTLQGNVVAAVAAVLHIANFSFGHTFGNPDHNNLFFPYWSLSLEEQFYLLLPFLVFFCRKRLTPILMAIIAVQLFVNRDAFSLPWNIVRTDGLFLGVLIAIWQTHSNYEDFHPKFLKSFVARSIFLAWLVISLIVLGSRLDMIPKTHRFSFATVISGIAVFVASFNQNYIVRGGPLKPILMWIGARSYGIYLAHIPIFAITREIFHRTNSDTPLETRSLGAMTLLVVSATVLTLIAVELNYRYLEKPLQEKGRRISKNYLERSDSDSGDENTSSTV